MDLPTTTVEHVPETIEDEQEGSPLFKCDLYDTEIVHKIALVFILGLATACVDNTTGDMFRSPASVAVDTRKELVDYLSQRSGNFVTEFIILEGGPEAEASDHPFDIISDFVDDFSSSKRNLFSRVSGWLLSEKREDKVDDFIQEMEINGFWLLDGREAIAQTLLKNAFHCNMKFDSAEELDAHVHHFSFRSMTCTNEGCNARFCALHLDKHDAVCPFKIIQCEQKCSDRIIRLEMDRHCITVCPMKLANCPLYAVGCQSTIPYCMIEQHCSDTLSSHLLYILQGIHKEASMEDLKRWAEQPEKAASSGQLAEARDMRSLTSKVKDIEAKWRPFEVHITNKDIEENMEISNTANGLDVRSPHQEQRYSRGMETSNLADTSSKAES
ncbi:hypothetical protein I3760_10G023300 [Carya illinoinensis]|nr:hypothetical protein I3760_10G023300 [Carya illinoinensis]KAG2683231.1 hypothetical protein I3760_10G023300 [Carya illinoinensis]KAG2683232.1 hypothetical protein I3760_10G023300 [Carya illinoinensis]